MTRGLVTLCLSALALIACSGCRQQTTRRSGPLAAMADSVLSLKPGLECVDVEDPTRAGEPRQRECYSKRTDSTITVTVEPATMRVVRLTRAWRAPAGGLPAELAATESALRLTYGLGTEVCLGSEETRARRWQSSEFYLTLTANTATREILTAYVLGRPKYAASCSSASSPP